MRMGSVICEGGGGEACRISSSTTISCFVDMGTGASDRCSLKSGSAAGSGGGGVKNAGEERGCSGGSDIGASETPRLSTRAAGDSDGGAGAGCRGGVFCESVSGRGTALDSGGVGDSAAATAGPGTGFATSVRETAVGAAGTEGPGAGGASKTVAEEIEEASDKLAECGRLAAAVFDAELRTAFRGVESRTAWSMSEGAVIVFPHFGQGAETPARWVGTRSFAAQCGQVNLIFFTSGRLEWG